MGCSNLQTLDWNAQYEGRFWPDPHPHFQAVTSSGTVVDYACPLARSGDLVCDLGMTDLCFVCRSRDASVLEVVGYFYKKNSAFYMSCRRPEPSGPEDERSIVVELFLDPEDVIIACLCQVETSKFLGDTEARTAAQTPDKIPADDCFEFTAVSSSEDNGSGVESTVPELSKATFDYFPTIPACREPFSSYAKIMEN
jgi:hypothetical protein